MNNKKNSAPLDLNDYLDYQPQHIIEFRASHIEGDIIDLNFKSLDQTDAFHFLKPNLQAADRRNDGRLRSGHLHNYDRLESGGWVCRGIDPLTMKINEWGCLKPDTPRWDEAKQKSIKYEHPHGIPTELFCLRVTYQIGLKIAKKHGLVAEVSYLDRMADVEPHDEDYGFWRWVLDNPQIKIIITEGAKKTASLLSAGYVAIGLPGIYSGYRSKINGVDCIPFLIPQLEVFCQAGREFVFCFDKDTNPNTISNVNKAISKTGKLLEHQKCTVSVINWIAPCKGVDDLIYNFGVDVLDLAFNSRHSLNEWRLDRPFDISPLPQTKVNSRYLKPSLAPDNLAGNIIAIKSAKGTGKTEYISEIIAPYLERGRAVLVITHRIQLAKALAKRLGINHVSEVHDSETGALFGYSLCVDSLHPKSSARFNPDDWAESIVVLDECEQVLWHMFNSPTCLGNRVAILQTFDKLIKTVAQSNGTIILSDADLSKVSIDYINNLAENRLNLWLLTNSYKPQQGNRKLHVYSSPAELLLAAEAAMLNGEQMIIHCSAQKTKSRWSTQNLETHLLQLANLRVLRIDAETVSDPTHPAFGCIEGINEIVAGYDVVLASPTIETGISIDVNHFDSVWALVNGVQTVDAVCQTLSRVRSDIPRHICITTSGIQKIGNGSDNPYALQKSQDKMAKANLTALSLAGLVEDEHPHHHHTVAWSLYAAKVNLGYNDYKQSILDKLVAEGYEIVTVLPSSDPLSVERVKMAMGDARELNYQQERNDKTAAPNPDDLELKRLQKKTAKTKAERHIEAKGVLTRRYLTEEIADELIIKDDGGWYPQIRLYYYLSIGREHLVERDKTKLKSLTDSGQLFAPDVNKVSLSAKVRALEAVDIFQFFGEDKVFTKDSLLEWHSLLKTCASDIKDYLGVGIGDKSTPITTAQRLLGLLGYRLEAIDRIRIDGQLVRRYQGVDCNVDDRMAVLERWLERDDRMAGGSECSTSSIRSNNSTGGTDERSELNG